MAQQQISLAPKAAHIDTEEELTTLNGLSIHDQSSSLLDHQQHNGSVSPTGATINGGDESE